MNKTLLLTGIILTSVFLWGCGEKAADESVNIEISEATETPKQDGENQEPDGNLQDEIASEEDPAVTEEEQEDNTIEEDSGKNAGEFSFKALEDLEFYYSSGAGAWQTTLVINEDGTFQGNYSDSEMGSTGEGYPNGICYQCTFEGKFTNPVKINDYTYSVQIEEMGYNQDPGTEEIIDGILYKYSTAHGLADSGDIYIYLPEAPYAKLPEMYQSWVWYAREDMTAEQLSFYGLYNEQAEAGFSSYKTSYRIDDLMAATKDWSDTLKASLQNDVLSQSEMNMKSGELYEAWDAALNTIWKELKAELPEDEFQKLLAEQRQWIKDKEAAMDEAGNEAKGGSLEPLLRNDTGAAYTEKRVYELYEIYKKLH